MNRTTPPKPPTRAATARVNGAKSHGPGTPAGRARSSANSLRHGLTAHAVVLPTESADEFEVLLNAFLARFQPADPVERELVEAMAAARWRLRRLYAIESSILEDECIRSHDAIAEEFEDFTAADRVAYAFQRLADRSHSLDLLVRYEAGLTRAYDRAARQLRLLQDAPGSPPERPPADSFGSFRNPASEPDSQPGTALPPAAIAPPAASHASQIWQDCTDASTQHSSRADPSGASREYRLLADRFRHSRHL